MKMGLFRWILAGALVCARLGSAQPASPPAQTFTDVVEVRVVNLEVVVTDREGNRVTGLGPEDFELSIDGEPVAVDYFSEIRDGVMATMAEGEQRQVPSLEGGALRTHYLVFVDEYFSIRRDRDRVIDGLIEQLPALGPEDRMAIVRYDGRELEMLTSWTGDQAVLRSAFERAKGRSSGGLQRISELRQSDQSFRRGGLGLEDPDFGRLSIEERYYASRISEQVQRVVTGAVSTLRGFAAPPGRKVMLLLAGGWPFDPAEYVADEPARLITESNFERGEELLEPLTDTANLLGYTLYPVDVPGFQTTSADASADDLSEAERREGTTIGARSFYRETEVQRSLFHLAEETGGVALINTARDRALERVVEDTRSFYWLGYTPERKGDDRRHEVEVRVRRPGLEVRGRENYFDFSRQREVTLAVESALYFGAPLGGQPLAVRIGRGEKSGLKTMKVPVTIGIPADAITLLPGAGGWNAQVELRVAVLDDRGATADTPVIPLSFTLEERPPQGTVLRYDTELKMRRKPHQLVVALYDVPSGSILSTSVEVVP